MTSSNTVAARAKIVNGACAMLWSRSRSTASQAADWTWCADDEREACVKTALACLVLGAALASAQAQTPSWLTPEALAAAKAAGRKVTVHIDGLAASMASVIAMVGDEITMADNALMMIHNPWDVAIGDARELRAANKALFKRLFETPWYTGERASVFNDAFSIVIVAKLLAGLASRRAEKKAQVIDVKEVKAIEQPKSEYNSYCATDNSQPIATPTPKNSGKARHLRMRRRKPRPESLKNYPTTTPPSGQPPPPFPDV